jgi:hypothetical protein
MSRKPGMREGSVGNAAPRSRTALPGPFASGQSNYGGLISTSLPLPAGGGFSPSEILFEVD